MPSQAQELRDLEDVLAGLSSEEVADLLGDDELAAQLSGSIGRASQAAMLADVERGREAAQGDGGRPLDLPLQQNIGRPLVIVPGVPGLALNVRGADDKSESLTVTLLLVSPAYPDGNKLARAVPPDCTARVTWGNGGVLAVARVDCRDGMQLTVSGSVVRVEIDLAGPPGTEALNVSAFVSYGNRPGRIGSPVLTLSATIAGGGGATLTIPDFAHDVEVYAADAAAVLLVNQNNPGGTLASVLKSAVDNSVRMTLVRGAYFVDVSNLGVGPVDVVAVFGISL